MAEIGLEGGNGVRAPYFIFKPKLIFLSGLPRCPAVLTEASDAQIYSQVPKLPFFCVASFTQLPVHQPGLVITISPRNVPGMDLSNVMMMEATVGTAVGVCHGQRGSFNYE